MQRRTIISFCVDALWGLFMMPVLFVLMILGRFLFVPEALLNYKGVSDKMDGSYILVMLAYLCVFFVLSVLTYESVAHFYTLKKRTAYLLAAWAFMGAVYGLLYAFYS